MTTMSADSEVEAGRVRCGCCGQARPAGRLVELGSTPGVYICDGCALWAARRSTRMPVIRLDPQALLAWLRARVRTQGPVARTIPILPSMDLDRTAAFYRSAGMEELARYEGYLVLGFRGVELHFTTEPGAAGAGQAFVLVPNAGRLWKQLKSQGAPGLGPVEDREHGLREFVVTDPDGNRIRVGSPIPE
jgi:catechol 2,3-dioxygenase-like lactoylglutathione lyase family enzyme